MNKIYYDGFEIINSDALNDRRQLKKIDSVIMFATDRYLTRKDHSNRSAYKGAIVWAMIKIK